MATFNANNQAAARGFLRRRVAPDVALLQEVKAAHWPTALIPVARLDGRKRESATGIDAPAFSVEPLVSGTIGSSAPKGALTAARIDMPAGLGFVAVSVYAQINRGLAYPTAQAIVEDLEPLLRSPAAERLLVGGDFNAWDQFAATPADLRARQIWQALWRRLEDLGLVNLLREQEAAPITGDGVISESAELDGRVCAHMREKGIRSDRYLEALEAVVAADEASAS